MDEIRSFKRSKVWKFLRQVEGKTRNFDFDSLQEKFGSLDGRQPPRQPLERRNSLPEQLEKKSILQSKMFGALSGGRQGESSSSSSIDSSEDESEEEEEEEEEKATGSGQGDPSTAKTKSETWVVRRSSPRISFLRNSQKTRPPPVDEASRWRRISNYLRACQEGLVGVVRTLLQCMSLFVVASWGKIDDGIKGVRGALEGAFRHVMSSMVHLAPRKLLKSFMIHICLLLPDLRNRGAVVWVLRNAPSKATKRVVSWYTQNVSFAVMWWHALLSLKDSSCKAFLVNVERVCGLPRKLMRSLAMGVASAFDFLARCLKTVSRGKIDIHRGDSKRLSFKIKRLKSHEEVENKKI